MKRVLENPNINEEKHRHSQGGDDHFGRPENENAITTLSEQAGLGWAQIHGRDASRPAATAHRKRTCNAARANPQFPVAARPLLLPSQPLSTYEIGPNILKDFNPSWCYAYYRQLHHPP